MRRLILILALCWLLTPSLALAQTSPTVVGYRTATGAAQAVTAATPMPVTAPVALSVSGGVTLPSEDRGAGNAGASTLRTVPAPSASSTPLAVVAVTEAEVEVLPALVGRQAWSVQVYSDVDGAVCCSLGTTTSACANAGFMLDASPAAGKAGGSAGGTGYSGAVTCRAMGAYTVSVARFQY